MDEGLEFVLVMAAISIPVLVFCVLMMWMVYEE